MRDPESTARYESSLICEKRDSTNISLAAGMQGYSHAENRDGDENAIEAGQVQLKVVLDRL
jgi:hypothetical protein